MTESTIAAQPKLTGNARRSSLDIALKAARGRLRWRRAMRGFASSFFVPAIFAALWVVASRFTLLEVPRWPVLLFFPLWLVGFLIWLFHERPTRAQSARYLDRVMGLEE